MSGDVVSPHAVDVIGTCCQHNVLESQLHQYSHFTQKGWQWSSDVTHMLKAYAFDNNPWSVFQ